MAKRIYDCFIFYNELDLLELRLSELYDQIDYFVLCEATVNFRGIAKRLNYADNLHRFVKYADKIIHVVVDDMPSGSSNLDKSLIPDFDPTIWERERFQRQALRRGLIDARPDDIVVISDCDEIVSSTAVKVLRAGEGYFRLNMQMYQFYLNMRTQSGFWQKVFAYSYKMDADIPDYSFVRSNDGKVFNDIYGPKEVISDAGWHFTFLGGVDKVKSKLAAYSHTDGWQRRMWDEDLLQDQMISLVEVGGGRTLLYSNIDKTFPVVVQNNISRYIELDYIKKPEDRLNELDLLWSNAKAAHLRLEDAYRNSAASLSKMRAAVRERGLDIASAINFVPASSTFDDPCWSNGAQQYKSHRSEKITQFIDNNVVMLHQSDGSDFNPDGNSGYFYQVPTEEGRKYTASCYIWIADEVLCNAVSLSLDGWSDQYQRVAVPDAVNQWQRITTTGTSPLGGTGANIVVRVHSKQPCVVYSTCWQLEEGDIATEYCPTH